MPSQARLTEEEQESLRALIAIAPAIKEMVDILIQVKSAFLLFIRVGRILKWLTTIFGTPVIVYYLLKKGDFASIFTLFRGD